jgi:hypothetical protein
MRKAVLVLSSLALSLALAERAAAQDTVVTRVVAEDTMVVEDRPLRTTFGIKGGLSFATLSESNASPNFGNQTGFAAGLHVAIPLGSVLMFQPEALLIQQGAATPSGPLVDEGAWEFTYITIPANLRVNFSTGGVQPYLLGGPYVGFRINCQFQDVDQDCDNYKDTDWGLGAGVGLKFGRQGGFFLEGRYTFGLQDINEIDAGFDTKNRAFLVVAGISF